MRNKVAKTNIILAISAVVFVAAIVFIVWAVNQKNAKPIVSTNTERPTEVETWGRTVKEDGVTYSKNQNITTVLFLGVDKLIENEDVKNSNGRSDTNMLLIMDKSTGTTKILSMSRDTMVDISVYNVRGEYAFDHQDHLNMQYSYGDSASRSCYLTKKTVSEKLLHGIHIDGVISLTAAGLNRLVNQMGGVTVTFDNDYTDIDERYVKGATVTIDGDEAERLTRYRDAKVTGSNETRVQRQLSLIESVFSTVKGKLDADSLEEMLNALGKDFYSDVDADTLSRLLTYNLEEPSYTLPGQVVEGDLHDEFYVDEVALDRLLINLFYVPVEK